MKMLKKKSFKRQLSWRITQTEEGKFSEKEDLEENYPEKPLKTEKELKYGNEDLKEIYTEETPKKTEEDQNYDKLLVPKPIQIFLEEIKELLFSNNFDLNQARKLYEDLIGKPRII